MEAKTVGRPAPGRETIQWVLDAIKANPQLHHQEQWEQPTECGTAMCVAGWAAFAHSDVLDAHIRTTFGTGDTGGWVSDVKKAEFRWHSIPRVARQVMELGFEDSNYLFYDCNNEEAVAALEILAVGGTVDWPHIFGGEVPQ